MTQLKLSRYIESDLDNIADYIAQDNPDRAVTLIRDIHVKFCDIQRNPLIYQLRSDIGEEARMATIGNYAILFRACGTACARYLSTRSEADVAVVLSASISSFFGPNLAILAGWENSLI